MEIYSGSKYERKKLEDVLETLPPILKAIIFEIEKTSITYTNRLDFLSRFPSLPDDYGYDWETSRNCTYTTKDRRDDSPTRLLAQEYIKAVEKLKIYFEKENDMVTVTLNQLLEMEQRLRERKNELERLVTSHAQETIHKHTDGSSVVQRIKYDVIDVDNKVSKLGEALYNIKHKIKEVNAMTKVEVDVDFKELMKPIEPAKV